MRRFGDKSRLVVWFLMVACCAAASGAPAQPSLDDLWAGNAHFRQVGELRFGDSPGGGAAESSSWFAARKGIWYAFNRVTVSRRTSLCPRDHARIVIRQSSDKGKTWSPPLTAVEPGSSAHGDGCAVLDGSTYYDESARTWHMLAQCLDHNATRGWALCHYSRAGASPFGRFVADLSNPIVRGGQLWSRICAGSGKACPGGVVDEGTPDIVTRQNGAFIVTFHGYDPKSGHGFRSVASTGDFHNWQVAGNGLPDDAMLGPNDCRTWMRDCAGVGEAATIYSGLHRYTIAESMDRSLLCNSNEKWAFALYRSDRGSWPRSGSGKWTIVRPVPMLTRSWPDPSTGCAVQYARWINDGGDIYLIYEDWEPHRAFLHRRLLKLVPGKGNVLQLG